MATSERSAPAGVRQFFSRHETDQTGVETALGDLRHATALLELHLTQGCESMWDSLTRERWGRDHGVLLWLSERIEQHVEQASDAFYRRTGSGDDEPDDQPTSDDDDPALPGADPHREWHREMEHCRVDHNHRPDDDDESERLHERICELRRLICTTPPTTLDGLDVQLSVMFQEMRGGNDSDNMHEAWRLSRFFLGELERAFEAYGLALTIERWCWRQRICSAPMWRDHPAMPEDLRAKIEPDPRVE